MDEWSYIINNRWPKVDSHIIVQSTKIVFECHPPIIIIRLSEITGLHGMTIVGDFNEIHRPCSLSWEIPSLIPRPHPYRGIRVVTVEGFLGSAESAMTGLSARIELS